MFRRYLESRPSISGEERGNSIYLTEHTSHVLAILRKHLLHHEFDDAAVTMETLSISADRVLEITRKAGIEVLLHDSESYGGCLQLFKQIFSKYRLLREETLLEMCLFIASHGQLQEAYDAMESYLSVTPYKDNPLHHGYCGLLQYMLYRKEKDGTTKMSGVHAKKALAHFNDLQHMKFSGTMKIDAFVHKHAELLSNLGQVEEAIDLLIFHRDKYPHDINPNRYVCDHLRQYCHDDRDLRLASLRQLVSLDESCRESVELAELLMEDDAPDYTECSKVVMSYLDYPSNGRDKRAWELLRQLQSVWPEFQSIPEWMERVKWWKKMYPDHFPELAALLS